MVSGVNIVITIGTTLKIIILLVYMPIILNKVPVVIRKK